MMQDVTSWAAVMRTLAYGVSVLLHYCLINKMFLNILVQEKSSARQMVAILIKEKEVVIDRG
jgi:hypothetical protein